MTGLGRVGVLSRKVMLEERTSKHRPGGKLFMRREQVKKSPEAGLISAEKRSFGTERLAGWRKVLDTQEFVNGRLSAGKGMASLVFRRLLWVNCLFPCAESISPGIHRIWSSWLPSGRGTRGDWGQGQEEEAL